MINSEKFAGYIIPKLRDVLFIAIFFGVILLGPRSLNIDGDLGRHITIGNYILSSKSIPTSDIFSHTMFGQPLTPHEWLTQVLLAAADHVLGLDGVIILEALIIALTFLLLFLDIYDRGNSYIIAGAFSFWAAAASSLHWIPRPHIFTFLFLVIWTRLIRKIANGSSKNLWLPPVIMLLWANSHGAFISGFVVWGCYLIGWIVEYLVNDSKPSKHSLRNLMLVGGLSLAASFINPSGWDLWETSIGYIQNSYLVSHTQEYLSPDFHSPSSIPFLAMVAFAVFIFSRGWNKVAVAESLLASGWIVMALYSARNIPLAAILLTPILGGYLFGAQFNNQVFAKAEVIFQKIEPKLSGGFWPVISTLLLIGCYHFKCQITESFPKNEFNKEIFPVAAVDWIVNNPPEGKVFNYFTWGGYLLYRLWPDQLVFIDGQTDFYGEDLTRKYESIFSATKDSHDLIEEYDISWVLIPIGSDISRYLVENSWKVTYQDQTAIILKKP